MLLHSDTLSQFQAIQSLSLFLYAVCLAEKQQMQILYSLVWHDQEANLQTSVLCTNYTIDMFLFREDQEFNINRLH
jgi:hypothetical protein